MLVNGIKVVDELDTIQKLLKAYHLEPDQVVIEINGEILKKESFDDRVLRKDDQIEIISFVGGG